MRLVSSEAVVPRYIEHGDGSESAVAGSPAASAGSSLQGSPPVSFSQLLRGFSRELDAGEALTRRAIHGGGAGAGMSPEGLIALQAGIYRYSEAVDLLSKLVDRATQSVKTTLQNQ